VIIQISEAKGSPKRQKLRMQMNGKFNDADENKYQKNITVEPLLNNYKKTMHLFIDRRLRNCICF
jgi:hypothetical protein